MGDPVVMLGVGAAKSGTSWLHRYLSDHPECHFRSIKELHYFNAFDWGQADWNLARVTKIRDRLRREADADIPAGRFANKVRQLAHVEHYIETLSSGREDTGAYLDYLTEGRGAARVVGELTPAYSLLSVERLRAMAGMAGDVRFVYVLRDPVERLWSHVRMIAFQRCRAPSEFRDRAANILSRVLRGDETEIAKRSDYAGALARLNAAVDPARLCLAIYEELFSGGALARICVFLGIAPRQPDLAKVVHRGAPLGMNADQRARARDWLAPQYAAARAQFGALPAVWNDNLERVS